MKLPGMRVLILLVMFSILGVGCFQSCGPDKGCGGDGKQIPSCTSEFSCSCPADFTLKSGVRKECTSATGGTCWFGCNDVGCLDNCSTMSYINQSTSPCLSDGVWGCSGSCRYVPA